MPVTRDDLQKSAQNGGVEPPLSLELGPREGLEVDFGSSSGGAAEGATATPKRTRNDHHLA